MIDIAQNALTLHVIAHMRFAERLPSKGVKCSCFGAFGGWKALVHEHFALNLLRTRWHVMAVF